jgi:RNA polymerase sigma-70 factor, ECF subfamily
MPDELDPGALARHHDRLCRAAGALCGSRDDVDDLVQDTYARVLSRRRRLQSSHATLPYLLRALRNTHVSGLRLRDRRPQTDVLDHDDKRISAPDSASPAAALLAREVLRAIAELPTQQRRIVIAVDVAGLSYQETASELDTPLGTVMSRLHRGRRRVARTVLG